MKICWACSYYLASQSSWPTAVDKVSWGNFDLEFWHWTTCTASARILICRKKAKHIVIDGTVPAQKRQGLVNNFQNDNRVKVALLSIQAAGVGLTLTVRPHLTQTEYLQALDKNKSSLQYCLMKLYPSQNFCCDAVSQGIWAKLVFYTSQCCEILTTRPSYAVCIFGGVCWAGMEPRRDIPGKEK